ncbi:MAG: glycosyltransferase family 4 protein, partial [Gammaproteobacteria bacterium]|nr:glycosyltransferase family 4 protein [Gammaproteobacteria bacterium]
LEAFARLHQVHKRAELTIAGNGPARADLERRAAELGVRSAVRFPGWVEPSNVTNYINAATVVIIPSRWREPFGLVALQAAQMARPVIAHRVGGLPDIIIDNETGMLVSPGDIHGLVGALSFLLEHPGRAIEMGKAARRRNDDVFNFQQFVSQYDELYRSLALDYVPLSVGEPLT